MKRFVLIFFLVMATLSLRSFGITPPPDGIPYQYGNYSFAPNTNSFTVTTNAEQQLNYTFTNTASGYSNGVARGALFSYNGTNWSIKTYPTNSSPNSGQRTTYTNRNKNLIGTTFYATSSATNAASFVLTNGWDSTNTITLDANGTVVNGVFSAPGFTGGGQATNSIDVVAGSGVTITTNGLLRTISTSGGGGNSNSVFYFGGGFSNVMDGQNIRTFWNGNPRTSIGTNGSFNVRDNEGNYRAVVDDVNDTFLRDKIGTELRVTSNLVSTLGSVSLQTNAYIGIGNVFTNLELQYYFGGNHDSQGGALPFPSGASPQFNFLNGNNNLIRSVWNNINGIGNEIRRPQKTDLTNTLYGWDWTGDGAYYSPPWIGNNIIGGNSNRIFDGYTMSLGDMNTNACDNQLVIGMNNFAGDGSILVVGNDNHTRWNESFWSYLFGGGSMLEAPYCGIAGGAENYIGKTGHSSSIFGGKATVVGVGGNAFGDYVPIYTDQTFRAGNGIAYAPTDGTSGFTGLEVDKPTGDTTMTGVIRQGAIIETFESFFVECDVTNRAGFYGRVGDGTFTNANGYVIDGNGIWTWRTASSSTNYATAWNPVGKWVGIDNFKAPYVTGTILRTTTETFSVTNGVVNAVSYAGGQLTITNDASDEAKRVEVFVDATGAGSDLVLSNSTTETLMAKFSGGNLTLPGQLNANSISSAGGIGLAGNITSETPVATQIFLRFLSPVNDYLFGIDPFNNGGKGFWFYSNNRSQFFFCHNDTNGFVGINLHPNSITNYQLEVNGSFGATSIGSYGTNSTLVVNSTGITNTTLDNYEIYGFTGVSVTQTNANGYGFSRGTITAPTDITLKPGAKLNGASCAANGKQGW
jgi:hypothetical protein